MYKKLQLVLSKIPISFISVSDAPPPPNEHHYIMFAKHGSPILILF